MNSTAKILLAVVIIIVLGIGAWIFSRPKDVTQNSTNTNTPATTQPTNEQNTSTAEEESSKNIITFTSEGFSPAEITVKAGESITVINDSGAPLEFSSNPHPDHTEQPELNIGLIKSGASKTFTLSKKGSWDYHNHLDPTQGGTINVE